MKLLAAALVLLALAGHAEAGFRPKPLFALAPQVACSSVSQTGTCGGGGGGAPFTGGTLSSATNVVNDICLTFGTTNTVASPCIQFNTTQNVDTGMLLTGTVSNHWVLAERQDAGFNFGHGATTHPILFIHSANQSTTQWVGHFHDGTKGQITTGAGNLRLASATGITEVQYLSLENGIQANQNVGLYDPGAVGVGYFPRNNLQTPDTGLIATGSSNSLLVAENGEQNFDFAHPAQTTPTIFIHSNNQNTTQWLGLAHNATHGVISTGLGPVALKGGAAVASAAALPLPTGNVFHVTGTTSVTSITSTGFAAGITITLIFDDVLTFTDGSNLVLAGNFVTTTSDTITLAYDGTNWYEVARSVN